LNFLVIHLYIISDSATALHCTKFQMHHLLDIRVEFQFWVGGWGLWGTDRPRFTLIAYTKHTTFSKLARNHRHVYPSEGRPVDCPTSRHKLFAVQCFRATQKQTCFYTLPRNDPQTVRIWPDHLWYKFLHTLEINKATCTNTETVLLTSWTSFTDRL
jgi:hypothetical protein